MQGKMNLTSFFFIILPVFFFFFFTRNTLGSPDSISTKYLMEKTHQLPELHD